MKTSLNQRGNTFVVVLAALILVVAVGVVGYQTANAPDSDVASNTSISTNSSTEPDQIKSAADIKQADQALDNTPIDSSVNPNQFDDDEAALR